MNKKSILSAVLAAALTLGSTTVFAQANNEETVEIITEFAQTNESSENDADSESDFFWGYMMTEAIKDDLKYALSACYTGAN